MDTKMKAAFELGLPLEKLTEKQFKEWLAKQKPKAKPRKAK